ncbi:polyprenyl synthetase [Pseudoxanthomonas sp. PXM03]|uniref:polyprenyl synthetase n=1 Tax=Pseudoxanthomonas sp. PXM03 TaxID=2769284 RepID=UPI00177CB4E7|nr:polyprenyl synthetase [Pseudoxanthomonas sp. PXM03]MBD9435723.1 polyprenyl synthetase [Pseudoxanthomonas sp. PXM03]
MDIEALLGAALREAGYGQDTIGSAMPRILRILEAEDVRIEMGRDLSRKEREYVRLQLELGLSVREVVAGLKNR